jgi:uncharacterized membrane protein
MAAGTGSAVVGGFYLAFSAVVMPALRRRPAAEAVATMVAINDKAVRPPFMVLFFGTFAACAAVVVTSALDRELQPSLRVAGGGGLFGGMGLDDCCERAAQQPPFR